MNALASIELPNGNVEAEALLCGAMMFDNKLIDRVADNLSPDDFSDEFFGHVFSVIVREASLGHAANPVTLRPYFDAEQMNVVCELSGSYGLVAFDTKTVVSQIRELARKRRLMDGLQGVLSASRDPSLTIEELVSEAEAAVAEAADGNDDGSSELSGADCVNRVLKALENHEPGVQSGIGSLDATLGPIRKKNLVIVGGRPGMGKSAVAISYAIGAARNKHGVLLISLEMSGEEIGERMAADLCFDTNNQVPYGNITEGRLSNDQARQVARAGEYLSDLPMTIVDIGSASLARINGLVRRHKRRMAAKGQKLELVIVDYLQLVRPDHKTNGLYEAITEVSRGLKALAKTHDIGVMALTQLSRKVEERQDKRPHMADLRDSGQIEQDADAVLLLYRNEYYLKQIEPKDAAERITWEQACQAEAGKIEFICAKRRRGPSGSGEGRYYTSFQAVRG